MFQKCKSILKELPGIEDVYASSAFQAIEVTFNENEVTADKIAARLEEAGYLGDVPMLSETGVAVEKKEGDGVFDTRLHTKQSKKPLVLRRASSTRVDHYGHALEWVQSKWMNNKGR